MLFGAKNRRTRRRRVAAHSLEYRRAVVNHVRHNVNIRVFPTDELAVMPDLFSLFQRHENSWGRPVARETNIPLADYNVAEKTDCLFGVYDVVRYFGQSHPNVPAVSRP